MGFRPHIVRQANQVTGKCAAPGNTIGRVVLVRASRDLKRVTRQSIIVSPMTIVQHTAAIRKAQAVVTDEGGLSSHAAVVCRELRKPCIVGTRIATRTFRDGELIEVDATKGIVQRLKGKSINSLT